MSIKKNDQIIVKASPSYVAAQSDPDNHKFVWSYEVSITNQSPEIVQLLNRFWRIIDMSGKIEEIQGVGVVGLQPLIKPNKPFHYVSYCQLAVPQGTMEGYYEMQNLEDEHFIVEIPKFILSAPTSITKTFRSRLH
ncbi:MAG: Co2+/Mg2+ efflux protein ApaG [Gammaproteobacteria bacterium]|nr:MAG: Co2+/Mg2+ efflux protein ApaG [Gammaproteobacteria bacterium]